MVGLTPSFFGAADVQGELRGCSPSSGLGAPSPLSCHLECPGLPAHRAHAAHAQGSEAPCCPGPLPDCLTAPCLCTCGSSSCRPRPTKSPSCHCLPWGPSTLGSQTRSSVCPEATVQRLICLPDELGAAAGRDPVEAPPVPPGGRGQAAWGLPSVSSQSRIPRAPMLTS